jgi:hypothetical protein
MGYRYDVVIACEEKAYSLFSQAWEKVGFRPKSLQRAGEDGYYQFLCKWDWLKWEGERVAAVESIMDKLDEEYDDIEGYAYKKLEIFEDGEARNNSRGLEVFADFCVEISFSLPELFLGGDV